MRLLLVPYTFVLLNWAAMRGLICYLRERDLDGLWTDPSGSVGAGSTAHFVES